MLAVHEAVEARRAFFASFSVAFQGRDIHFSSLMQYKLTIAKGPKIRLLLLLEPQETALSVFMQ